MTSEIGGLAIFSVAFVFGILFVRNPDAFSSPVMRHAPRGIKIFFSWVFCVAFGLGWLVLASKVFAVLALPAIVRFVSA